MNQQQQQQPNGDQDQGDVDMNGGTFLFSSNEPLDVVESGAESIDDWSLGKPFRNRL